MHSDFYKTVHGLVPERDNYTKDKKLVKMNVHMDLLLLTCLNVSRGQLSSVVKMNADEFTLSGRVVFSIYL